MRILVDMDGIIVNLTDDWLHEYNIAWDDDLTTEHLTEWDTDKFVKPECGKKIYDILERPGFFRSLSPLDGALEGIRALEAHGHTVAICSAPAGPVSAAEKIQWVQDHLGWSHQRMILTHNKSWIEGDLLIDDSPGNLRRWVPRRPAIAIGYPYNAGIPDVFYAGTYHRPEEAWSKIVEICNRRPA